MIYACKNSPDDPLVLKGIWKNSCENSLQCENFFSLPFFSNFMQQILMPRGFHILIFIKFISKIFLAYKGPSLDFLQAKINIFKPV